MCADGSLFASRRGGLVWSATRSPGRRWRPSGDSLGMSSFPAPGHGNGKGSGGHGNGPFAQAGGALSDHLPPQNLEAERSVLGGILLDNDVLHEIAQFLTPEDFYRDA